MEVKRLIEEEPEGREDIDGDEPGACGRVFHRRGSEVK